MSRGRTALKSLIWSVIFLVVAALQMAWPSSVSVLNQKPDLLLTAGLTLTVIQPGPLSFIMTAVSGLVLDVTAGRTPGIGMLLFSLAVLPALQISQLSQHTPVRNILLASAAGTAVWQSGTMVVLALSMAAADMPISPDLLRQAGIRFLGALIINTILALTLALFSRGLSLPLRSKRGKEYLLR